MIQVLPQEHEHTSDRFEGAPDSREISNSLRRAKSRPSNRDVSVEEIHSSFDDVLPKTPSTPWPGLCSI